jgi:hypothetical protein
MGTTEKLHNSHFYNMSVAAGMRKHQKLILSAQTQLSSKLHPFVEGERSRLKARKHLKAVDELTKEVDLPDALKHHAAFNQVYSWLLTQGQHEERMGKLKPQVNNRLAHHCDTYKNLRDKNRLQAMSDSQRKNFFAKQERDREKEALRREKFRNHQSGAATMARAYAAQAAGAGGAEECVRERRKTVFLALPPLTPRCHLVTGTRSTSPPWPSTRQRRPTRSRA